MLLWCSSYGASLQCRGSGDLEIGDAGRHTGRDPRPASRGEALLQMMGNRCQSRWVVDGDISDIADSHVVFDDELGSSFCFFFLLQTSVCVTYD